MSNLASIIESGINRNVALANAIPDPEKLAQENAVRKQKITLNDLVAEQNRIANQNAQVQNPLIAESRRLANQQTNQAMTAQARKAEMSEQERELLALNTAIGDDFESLDPESQARRYQGALNAISSLGVDISDAPESLDRQMLNILRATGAKAGGAAPKFQFGASSVVQGEDGSLNFATQQRNPKTGEVRTVLSPIDGELANNLGLTAKGRTDQAAAESRAKELGKSQAQNIDSIIDQGLLAAESLPELNRTLELLDSVETGGINRLQQAVKNTLGKESADEGELSFLLGKNVLGQLKTVFGSAFTEKEGSRLERLEASIGRSPAANRRIIEQAIRIAQRNANRALKAAQDNGDQFAVDDINAFLNFKPEQANTESANQFTLPNGIKVKRVQ